MITSTTITNSGNSIVTLATAKLQLRLESSYTAEDDLITLYINAAVTAAESYINGAIQAKTLVIKLDEMPTGFTFSLFPVRSITSISYYDVDNSSQNLVSGTDYHVETDGEKYNKIVFDEVYNTYDRPDAVTITAAIGYVDSDAVPVPIKQAILLMVSDMYERREDRADVNYKASSALLHPYRKYI